MAEWQWQWQLRHLDSVVGGGMTSPTSFMARFQLIALAALISTIF